MTPSKGSERAELMRRKYSCLAHRMCSTQQMLVKKRPMINLSSLSPSLFCRSLTQANSWTVVEAGQEGSEESVLPKQLANREREGKGLPWPGPL